MKIKFLLGMLILSVNSFAHAIWIETNSTGIKGKQHQVNIFFGEYAENERDSVASWFSNLKEISLYLVLPDGNKVQLILQPAIDHYTSSFVPDREGVYTLSVSHTVADVYGDSKIEYYTAARVSVNSSDLSSLPGATLLAIQPLRPEESIRQPVSLTVYNNQQILPKARVVIASPDGWTKTVYSDEKGSVSFVPAVEGRYMIEAIRSDKTPGTHGGKPYKSVTHLATYCIDVRQ